SPSPQPDLYIDTEPDMFSIFKRHKDCMPSTCPDEAMTLNSIADAPTVSIAPDPSMKPDPTSVYGQNIGSTNFTDPSSDSNSPLWFSPFLNASVCRLMRWFYSSTMKMLGDLNRLVHEVILMPNFHKSDLSQFDAAREAECLDEPDLNTSDNASPFQHDGWTEDLVTLPLPPPNAHSVPEDTCPEVKIPNIWHRSLIDIIQTTFQDPQFNYFHVKGFMQMWYPPGCENAERIHGEVYTSHAFLE
ncbi:hypothetical protein IW261DRAFT_1312114, partial [Armillaria novae-zelandiae]